MLLYLVRHGETDWNVQRRIQGSTDIPLNAVGRAQAAATGKLLARRQWDAIFASPLARAYETGAIIAAELGLPAPTPLPALVERNYGQAEGLTDTQIELRFPGDAPVPGREPRSEVIARVQPALMQIAESHPDQAVIVVSHGAVIRGILTAIDPGNAHGSIRNGSIHSFEYIEGSFQLIEFDDPIEEESEGLASDELEEQNALERRP